MKRKELEWSMQAAKVAEDKVKILGKNSKFEVKHENNNKRNG